MDSKRKCNWVASKCNMNKPNFKYLSVDEYFKTLKLCQNESYHQKIEILQKHGTIH